LFLSGERSLVRKAQEAAITIMMEALMDKQRIFEIYLNVVEWGDGVFGAEAAARHYFGTNAAQLNPLQAARLAAMLPRPRFFDKNRNFPYLARRAESIEKRMYLAQLP
jgi:monofunctional biosynthetic peptidoglycan transglycosylase